MQFHIQLNKFTTDDIVSKRDSIAIEKYLSSSLTKENFQLEQLTSGLKYPFTIVESVNTKNSAIQQALTPEILEKMWIEKWNGVLPVYGQTPTLFKDITK